MRNDEGAKLLGEYAPSVSFYEIREFRLLGNYLRMKGFHPEWRGATSCILRAAKRR